MTDIYTAIAEAVAADLRAEGCTEGILVTAATRASQPKWARQELAGRILLKRDIADRMPSEDRLTYEQSIAALIARADIALGMIVRRGPSASAMLYRLMSYHTHLDDLAADWAALLAELSGAPVAKDLTKARALVAELGRELG